MRRGKSIIRKETHYERVERKKKEYAMAFVRTASNVVGIIVSFLSLGVSILIFVKVYASHGS